MAEYKPITNLMNRLVLQEHNVINAGGADYPGVDGENHIWNVDIFKQKFQIKIIKQSPDHEGHANMEIEMDLLNIDAAVVNSIRRILLSEVPSMAIEKVYIKNNNSLIMDEVLAHRLGLIPLKADARMFEYFQQEEVKGEDPNQLPPASEVDTLVFDLNVECYNKNKAQPGNQLENLVNSTVYTSDLKWKPVGSQQATFSADPIRPVHDNIIIAKMRSKHAIEAMCYAYKGVGKDHSKFSPVATASYRLLPEVTLLEKVMDERAERLQQCFSPGTIEMREEDGHKVAVVESARYDSCSRNVFRHDDLKDSVQLTKKLDHFIFNIESVGAVTPDVLFSEACKVLQGKCIEFLDEMKRL